MLRQLGRRCSQAARSAAVSSSRAPSQNRCASSAASEAATAPVYTVFGASGGIGSALSKRLATHPGASVVLVGRDAAKLDHLKNQLVNPGSHAGIAESRTACIVADVTDSKQVSGAVVTALCTVMAFIPRGPAMQPRGIPCQSHSALSGAGCLCCTPCSHLGVILLPYWWSARFALGSMCTRFHGAALHSQTPNLHLP